MSEPNSPRKVVVLDTNATHFLDLFVRAAVEKSYRAEDTEDDELVNRLYTADEGYNRSLKKGRSVIAFILRDDVQLELSQVAKIELLCGKVRGAAIESAAKEGVPDRMWTRIEETFIRDRTKTDLAGMTQRVEALGAALESWGVILTSDSDQSTRDVLDLAMVIVGSVYMSAADSIVYATALAARADLFITEDGYLHQTVNLLHNPQGDPYYVGIKRRLEELCESALPEARRCRDLSP